MHFKTHNSVECKSHEQTGFNNLSDKKNVEFRESSTETGQHDADKLPHVNSFIKRYLRLDDEPTFHVETCHQPLEKCDVDDKELIRLNISCRTLQFADVEEKCGVDKADFNKATYPDSLHGEVKSCTDGAVNYIHTSKQIDSSKNFAGSNSSETISPSSISVIREHSQHTLEEISCSQDKMIFINHSQMSISGHYPEPMSPDISHREKRIEAVDKSNIDDSYQSHLSTWEQENDRFVHYTFRTDTYSQNTFVCDISRDNNNTNSLLKSNGLTNNNLVIDNTFPQTYLSDGSCSNFESNSRRRRRRVQTPVQRSAANMRERRRMCHLNVAFDRLKERLPSIKHKQKLSRIQTLKAAIDYIHLLQESLSMC